MNIKTFLFILFAIIVNLKYCFAQSDLLRIETLIDSIKLLDNKPHERAKFVSKINHIYI